MALWKRLTEHIRRNGAGYTLRRLCQMADERLLRRYDRAFRQNAPDDVALACQRANQPDAGCISIAVPLYNTRPAFLTALTDSLLAQTYANWQAVLYDGGSTDPQTLSALEELPDDPRLQLIRAGENRGISGNTNAAIAHCTGAYVALCDHDDVLAPDALWHAAQAVQANHPDLIYTDEDKLTEDGRIHTDAHIKPDFSPDSLRSGNYVCHLMVIRRDVLDAVGGLRPAFDGSQDHDLALRVTERGGTICHIPRVLYHWRTVGTSMSHQHLARCQDAAARAVTEHMARIGWPGTCTVEDGFLRLRYELRGLSVEVIRVPAHASAAWLNQAAQASAAEVLLFADERLRLSDGFADELLMYAQRPDVGAVTPQIVDHRGRVLHAGYELQGGKLTSPHRGLPAYSGGWHGHNRTSCNVDAVSPLCFMIRRAAFQPIPDSADMAQDMADWCAELQQQRLRHVYTPHARAALPRRSIWKNNT